MLYEVITMTSYNESNSTLQTIIPGPYVRIGGVALDPEGNLWMTNSNVAEPISVLKSDGTWKSYRADNLITSFGALVITSYSIHYTKLYDVRLMFTPRESTILL